MNEFAELFKKSKALIDNARSSMGVVVNAVTVYTSYLLGKYMIEEEQQGSERAQYGARVLDSLSVYLTSEYGRGFSRSNLAGMRKFYLTYKDRESQIVQSGIGQLGTMQENGQLLIAESPILRLMWRWQITIASRTKGRILPPFRYKSVQRMGKI